eukprot:XP_001701355.1 predicted protein [Chlamydomonas reinhardtii]
MRVLPSRRRLCAGGDYLAGQSHLTRPKMPAASRFEAAKHHSNAYFGTRAQQEIRVSAPRAGGGLLSCFGLGGGNPSSHSHWEEPAPPPQRLSPAEARRQSSTGGGGGGVAGGRVAPSDVLLLSAAAAGGSNPLCATAAGGGVGRPSAEAATSAAPETPEHLHPGDEDGHNDDEGGVDSPAAAGLARSGPSSTSAFTELYRAAVLAAPARQTCCRRCCWSARRASVAVRIEPPEPVEPLPEPEISHGSLASTHTVCAAAPPQRTRTTTADSGEARRPIGYWAAFNGWWRGKLREQGCRPSQTELAEWFEANAPYCWQPDEAPSLKELKTHAKCLRSTEQVRLYFRKYRAARKGPLAGFVPFAFGQPGAGAGLGLGGASAAYMQQPQQLQPLYRTGSAGARMQHPAHPAPLLLQGAHSDPTSYSGPYGAFGGVDGSSSAAAGELEVGGYGFLTAALPVTTGGPFLPSASQDADQPAAASAAAQLAGGAMAVGDVGVVADVCRDGNVDEDGNVEDLLLDLPAFEDLLPTAGRSSGGGAAARAQRNSGKAPAVPLAAGFEGLSAAELSSALSLPLTPGGGIPSYSGSGPCPVASSTAVTEEETGAAGQQPQAAAATTAAAGVAVGDGGGDGDGGGTFQGFRLSALVTPTAAQLASADMYGAWHQHHHQQQQAAAYSMMPPPGPHGQFGYPPATPLPPQSRLPALGAPAGSAAAWACAADEEPAAVKGGDGEGDQEESEAEPEASEVSGESDGGMEDDGLQQAQEAVSGGQAAADMDAAGPEDRPDQQPAPHPPHPAYASAAYTSDATYPVAGGAFPPPPPPVGPPRHSGGASSKPGAAAATATSLLQAAPVTGYPAAGSGAATTAAVALHPHQHPQQWQPAYPAQPHYSTAAGGQSPALPFPATGLAVVVHSVGGLARGVLTVGAAGLTAAAARVDKALRVTCPHIHLPASWQSWGGCGLDVVANAVLSAGAAPPHLDVGAGAAGVLLRQRAYLPPSCHPASS